MSFRIQHRSLNQGKRSKLGISLYMTFSRNATGRIHFFQYVAQSTTDDRELKSSAATMVQYLAPCRLHDGTMSPRVTKSPYAPFLRYNLRSSQAHETSDERGYSIRKARKATIHLVPTWRPHVLSTGFSQGAYTSDRSYPPLCSSILLSFSRRFDESIQPILVSVQHRIGLLGG